MILCQKAGARGVAVGWGTALQVGRLLMNQTGRKEKDEKYKIYYYYYMAHNIYPSARRYQKQNRLQEMWTYL